MKIFKTTILILITIVPIIGNLAAAQKHIAVPDFSASSSSATGSIARASTSQSDAKLQAHVIKNDAYSKIGLLYLEDGNGVTKNVKEALRIFQLGNTKGDWWSTFYLGDLYLGGDIEQDGKRALQYFETVITGLSGEKTLDSSLKKLLGYAYRNCFYLYWYGVGIEKDQKQGYFCIIKALQHNNEETLNYLKEIVQSGDSEAACLLGKLYESGQEVGVDLERAFLFYVRAAKLNNSKGFEKARELVWSSSHGLKKYLVTKLGEEAAQIRLMTLIRFFVMHTPWQLVGQNCPICWKEFQASESMCTVVPCLHSFCAECSQKLLNTNPRCPFCLQTIRNRQTILQ